MTCATRRIIAAATITAGLLVTAASAATRTESFTAVFHDRLCGGDRLCGYGVIDHYGRVTTVTMLSRLTPGPEPGCQTVKGTRTATLARSRRSTLGFAIQGPACGVRAWGTFRIVSGTGTFSSASGSGVIWGAPWLVHYYGVIRLDR